MVNIGPVGKFANVPIIADAPEISYVAFEAECAYCGSMVLGEKCQSCGAPRVAAGDSLKGVVVVNGMTEEQFKADKNEIMLRLLMLPTGWRG